MPSRTIGVVVLGALWLVGCAGWWQTRLVVPQAIASVVMIRDAVGGSAGGLLVGQADGIGYVITPAHVADDGDLLVSSADAPDERLAGRLVAKDGAADLALVAVAGLHGVAARLSATTPPSGTSVWVVGFPAGAAWAVSRSIVSRVDRADDTIELTGGVFWGGSSGGEVFDDTGAWIGLLELQPLRASPHLRDRLRHQAGASPAVSGYASAGMAA